MQKITLLILTALVIVLFCGASFIFGLYIGKVKLSEKQTAVEKQNLIGDISEKIKKLPGMEVFMSQPPDVIKGRIKSISGDTIFLLALPISVENLFKAEKEFQINVSDATEIYYLELNAKTSLFEKTPLAFEQLKPEETIAVTFDLTDKSGSIVNALKIKANR